MVLPTDSNLVITINSDYFASSIKHLILVKVKRASSYKPQTITVTDYLRLLVDRYFPKGVNEW